MARQVEISEIDEFARLFLSCSFIADDSATAELQPVIDNEAL